MDNGGVPKGVAKLFGWLLLALVNLSAVDHYIMLVRDSVNADRAKRKRFDAHAHLRRYYGMNKKDGNRE
jgi:hypothetical protein